MIETPTRVKLISTLRPVPTIVPESQPTVHLPPAAILETVKAPRKAPTMRVFQKDQLDDFKKKDEIKCIEDIVSKGPENCEKGVIFDRKEDILLIYKIESNGLEKWIMCPKLHTAFT